MITRILAAAVVMVALSTPAYAFKCPALVNQVDQALAEEPDLTSEQLAEVKKLRDDGEGLHKTGKHSDAVAALNEALEILGVKTTSSGSTY